MNEGLLQNMKGQAGDVAIVGMACLFPGAGHVRAFWENIVGKMSAIGDPPPGWDHGGFFFPDSDEARAFYCRRGGFLRDLAEFDPLAYGVMPNSVDGAEPEHFLALRVAHEALADAGYLERPFARDRAGVILGRGVFINRGNIALVQHTLVIDQTLRLLRQLHPEHSDEELAEIRAQLKASLPPVKSDTAAALVPNVMCGRIANRLDLRGPNFVVDAACASSLIAVALASEELRSRRCDLMLAGGINVGLPPLMVMGFCEAGVLSRNQTIRPFDAQADGTILGEGVGVVVLKRLEDARRDSDRIYAVIKAVGVSSDGRAVGLLAPRLEGEELALRRAYEQAGVSPDTVALVEAHGTATAIGDLTEIQALRRVFGERQGPHARCALGTVKSMIGHTIPAAGVAGLIKAALALYHRVLPPTLNCEHPNPRLELDRTPFYVNTELRPWVHDGREPRRAGVNAFGFGGINAHAILEEPPDLDESRVPSYRVAWDADVVILRGETRRELLAQGERLDRYLEAVPDARLLDVAYTLNTALEPGGLRLAVVASSAGELRQKLAYATRTLQDEKRRQIKDVSGIYFVEEPLARQGQLAFMFPGEGAQYRHMMADLCLAFPEVRKWFDRFDVVFAENNRDLVPSQVLFPPALEPPGDDPTLWRHDIALGMIEASSHGLRTILEHLAITPDVLVGHSSGVYPTLSAAGVLVAEAEEGLSYAIKFNKLRDSTWSMIPDGVLAAVGVIRPGSVEEVLAECPGPLFVVADNCPHQVILGGTEDTMPRALEALRRRGAICAVLPWRRLLHTPLAAGLLPELTRHYQVSPVGPPKIPSYSCSTARRYPEDPAEARTTFIEQWCRPVRFRETIEAMYADGIRIFVEVGAGNNLCGFVDDTLRKKRFVAVPLNVATRSGLTQLNHALGLLASHGVNMDLGYLYERRGPRRLDLDRAGPVPSRDGAGSRRTMRLELALPTLSLPDSPASRRARVPLDPLRVQSHAEEKESPLMPEPLIPEPQVASGSGALSPVPTYAARPTDGPGPPAPDGVRAAIMSEYLRTMERFLDVQRDVVQAFLHGAASERGVAQARPLWAAGLPPAELIRLTPPVAQTSSPAPAVPLSTIPILTVPAAASNGPVASERVDAPIPARSVDPAQRLLAIVGDKTGYPLEMLDPSLSMEADLGIDSIKRIEILGTFQRETGLVAPEDMEEAASLRTLQEVIDWIRRKNETGQTRVVATDAAGA